MKTIAILFILTSHSMLGDTGKPTGFWLEELAAPYSVFKKAGYEITIASIKGGAAPIDPRSQKPKGQNPASVDKFLNDNIAMELINNTISIDELDATEYDVIFLPGGHGAMWDFPDNQRLSSIISDAFEQKHVIAAVCHGPAGLVNAVDKNGAPVVKDRKLAAFTNAEEAAVGLTNAVPFLLESRLRALGANVSKAPDFESYTVADDNLITGQNPASSTAVAEQVVDYLQMKSH